MQVCSLGYVWIESTQPSLWQTFGTQILGMMSVQGADDDPNVYLKLDERPYRFAVYKGQADRLALCGWELRSETDFHKACAVLDERGIDYRALSPQQLCKRRVKEAVSLQDPAGNVVELYWGAELDFAKFVSPVGIDRFVTGLNGSMGFGHVVLPAANLQQVHDFYTEVLGFADSDYMHFKMTQDSSDPGQGLYFMHVDNPRHHSLALCEQAENAQGCVHLMLEVHSLDEVGYCLDRVQQRKIPIVSSLGRHSNDRMVSFYMQSPAGFAIEFGCGGLQIDWHNFTPTVTALPSLWGHHFNREALP